MKKKIAALLMFAAVAGVYGASWEVGNSTIKIANAKNKAQALAAAELTKHLELVAGKKLSGNPDGFTFHIGTVAPGGKKARKSTEANYSIIGKNVYFWGYDKVPDVLESDKSIWLDSRNTSTGTMSAVYNFLENELGILWIRPGDDGIIYKQQPVVELPDKKEHSWIMPLIMTGVRTYYWRFRLMKEANAIAPEAFRMTEAEVNELQYQDKLYARRQRHGLHFYFRYGHAFGKWWEKYGKDHPEWFGLDTAGRRGLDLTYRGREKLCLSNPEVIEAIAKEYIAAGRPLYYNVCPNDGTPGFCHCKNCLALDTRKPGENFYAHLTDRYLWFWNKLAARLMKERKDVTIVTYIYSYYRLPPRREKVEFPDNMLFGMVPNMFDDNVKFFSEWKKAGAKRIFLRPNDLCHGTPMMRGLEKRIYDKFQQARTFNIFGTDYDGGFGTRSIDLECYVAFRMVHDPELSFDDIMKEYCSAFGAAAPEVAEFYAKWREQGEKIIPMVDEWLKKRDLFLNDAGQIPGVVNQEIDRYYPTEIFQATDAILARGLKKQLTPAERTRLEELRIQNQHADLYRQLYAEYHKMNNKKPNDLEAVSRKLYDFRVKYRKQIGGRLCSAFGGSGGESIIWQSVKWYRKDILKQEEAADGIMPLIDSNFARPGSLRFWRKRDAFLSHDYMAGAGVTLKSIPKVDTIALSYRKVQLEAGKTYVVSGEVCIPKGAGALRFRMTFNGKSFSKYIYSKTGELEKYHWEFSVPVDGALSLFVYTGPGNKPLVLRSVKLQEKVVKKLSAGVLADDKFTDEASIAEYLKRKDFINVSAKGAAIKTSSTRDDAMGISRSFKLKPGKTYAVEAECEYSEPNTYIRFRFAGLGKKGNLYARSADGKPVKFTAMVTVPETFKGNSITVYACGSPGSGKPVYLRSFKIIEK